MDVLAHYLWAVAIYWFFRKPKKWIVGFTGALPDAISFGPFMVAAFILGTYLPGKPEISTIPSFVLITYNVTHSFVVIGIIAGLLYAYKREWWHLTWGWLFHIISDIPTHTREFFPTPFLWPLSELTVNGFSWAQWWFMAFNYTALALAFTYLILRDRKPTGRARVKNL